MSEAFTIHSSPRGPDESGELRTEYVVAVDFLFVGRLTLQLNGFRARENIREKQIQALKFAKFIYFMRFKENPLPDS